MKFTHSGFTFLGLMVCITILSIITSIASFSYGPLLAKNRQDNKMSLLKTNLAYARNSAVSYNLSITFCPMKGAQCTNNWQDKIYLFTDANANQFLDDNDTIIFMLNAIPATDTLTYPRHAITYRSDGSIAGFQSGSFIYCLKDYPDIMGKRLTISQAGRFRIRDIKCQSDK
ncbi:GspH/FimT family protein [Pseudoalteromonas tunicata]|uniref:GspH/FimT family protein n=1 Tax=Pseudoalteromonas tunicata TaxID=314281 RepID=UPI00273D34D2|nr:GspH/FimT family protein [Pseudoalteromonas tunicata]MDP4983467.1 GspH/FimT family protein [Pseudoalteromonas tunicata]